MSKRNKSEVMAATKMDMGTDVNFGTLTEKWEDTFWKIPMLKFSCTMK
jgi:hypothetical protein